MSLDEQYLGPDGVGSLGGRNPTLWQYPDCIPRYRMQGRWVLPSQRSRFGMTQTDIHDALVKSEFDFQGRLGNFLISDLLQMIQLSGKTGTLTLLQGWNNRTITFEKGRITYVASGSRLPSQFDLLVRTGRLTRHQVEAFRQRRPGKTEEEMIDELIARKLLDRTAIERC